MSTEKDLIALYDNETRERECIEYLVAAAQSERTILDEVYADKPEQKPKPEPEYALAALLAGRAVFLSTHWSEKEWPEEARQGLVIYANCNDVFAWGCADGEAVRHDEIVDLFDHWDKDRDWGAAVWCARKRRLMPQPPVERIIRHAGIWNLDTMGLAESPFRTDWSEKDLQRYGTLPAAE